jgi:4-amino-4-deoxy-L-arabinose transferase-like glycosyltransferase
MGLSDAQASAGLRWAVVGGAALLLLAGLGNVGAWAPDEPRYLQVAEELRTAGRGPSDWVLLHLNGEVYDQKPPLYFWLAAAIGAPRGHVSEIAARLPSGLAGIALVALTLALGTRLFGGRVGVLGAALLLTCFEFARNARRVQLDVLLALCETVALVCFWRIDRGIGTRGWPLFGLHAALGLAVLTKGPVGFLVPVLVMAGYLAWERRLGELPRLLPAWGLLLSLGPALAWLAAAAALAPSGFAGDMVGSNILARFFTGTSHVRPFYYYLDTYPLDCLPWTLLWPAVFVAGRQVFRGSSAPEAREPERRRAWRFLLAWVGASLVFFSLSSGKRGLYLLPTFPAMALLCADSLVRLLAGRARMPRGLATLAAVMGLLFGLLGLEFAAARWWASPRWPWSAGWCWSDTTPPRCSASGSWSPPSPPSSWQRSHCSSRRSIRCARPARSPSRQRPRRRSIGPSGCSTTGQWREDSSTTAGGGWCCCANPRTSRRSCAPGARRSS